MTPSAPHATVPPDPDIALLRTSDYLLLLAAFLSFLLSVYLWFRGQKEEGAFVGIWVPSILAFGCFLRLAQNRGPRA